MAFVLSKTLWLVAQPGHALVLLLSIGALLLWTRWRRGGRAIVALTAVCWLALAVLPIDEWTLAPLENRFPSLATPPESLIGIILIGGATETEISEARGQPSVNSAAERLIRFAALARARPDARLAFAGGSGLLFPGHLREADVIGEQLTSLGVDVERIVFERASRNTYENAVNLKALIDPMPGERWLLITSAYHMPRAVGVFRRLGWEVIADPVDYRSTGNARLIDPDRGLDARLGILTAGAKEWVGLLAYYWMGRTSALFPGPAP